MKNIEEDKKDSRIMLEIKKEDEKDVSIIIQPSAEDDKRQWQAKANISPPYSLDKWKDYFAVHKSTRKRKCLFCNNIYSENTSITILKEHLVSKHKEFKQLPNHSIEPFFSQEKDFIFEKHDILMKMIIDNGLPFSIVSNKSFRDFCLSLNKLYKIPDRITCKSLVCKAFTSQKDKLQHYLSAFQGKMSITTDLWTSLSGDPIIGVTGHLIDSNWDFKHFVLDVSVLPYPHNGNVIAKYLYDLMISYGISKKVLLATTDSAPNMINAINSLNNLSEAAGNVQGIFRFACTAHILNLAIKKACIVWSNSLAKFFNNKYFRFTKAFEN